MTAGTRLAPTCLLIFLFIACAPPGFAAWTTVGDGIEYQQFAAPGPNNVFVARMLKSNTNATIETCLANGKLSNAPREIVRYQAARLDDAINYWGQSWGQRNQVRVAINGDFNDPTYVNTPLSGQVLSGWYAKRFWDSGGDSGFGWSLNRTAWIGDCVYHQASKQFVTYTNTGVTQEFSAINPVVRPSGKLVIYTPQFDDTTKTDGTGVEVVVQMTRPMLILPTPAKALGYVREIRQNAAPAPIPFDCIVLSATGNPANQLLQNVAIGSEVGVSQEITNCSGGPDWTKTYASIGGNFIFLRGGTVYSGEGNAGLTNRAPRTAIAMNATYIFFVVCDGRNPGISEGMSMTELGNFCKNVLGCTDGINQDGGGSSTMIVNGELKNDPSDNNQTGQGTGERPVMNGIMMVNVLPKVISTRFAEGNPVRVTQAQWVYLGPGTNYGYVSAAAANQTGTIASHSLNGVFAKGKTWWKVDLGGGNSGWIDDAYLQLNCAPPTAVTVSDDGTWTPSLTTLRASWTASTAGCGRTISRYEYAVGTLPTVQNVKGWTSAGTALSVTDSSLSLVDGQKYYVQVRAVDSEGLVGAASASDGITVAPGLARISDAWARPNGSSAFSIRNKTVTLSNSTEFYVEESDRSAGIKVVSTANPGKGAIASAAGVMGMSGTQRALMADVVTSVPGTASVAPLGFTGANLGGGDIPGTPVTPGIPGSVGLYNLGLVVRIAGRIDFRGNAAPYHFYIDDGSGLSSDGHRGVRVESDSIAPPSTSYAAVTGVVTSKIIGGLIVPVIVVREAADIVGF